MAFPPLTRTQLMERCDLAGVARVVAVTQPSLHYPALARLVFLSVTKGVPKSRWGFVHVRLQGGRASGEEAAWSDQRDYPVGATVSTHLDWNGAEEVYQTTWPGAVQLATAPGAGKAQVA